MDGLANFGLLRERLGKAEDKTALMQLEMIRINALEEFRKLTQDRILMLDGITYDAVKRHSMTVEKKERVVFSLGWECLKEAKPAARDKFFDTDITLRRLDTQPNCAMLHVLAMIENVTDGDGAPQVVAIRYNFYLIDDTNNVFRDLIDKIPVFYPKVPVGTVENIEDNEPISADTENDENITIEKMLTSQLIARYHFSGDTECLDEFHRRMEACGISKEKAEAFMTSDIEIITRLDKKFLTEPGFMKTWFVKLDEAKLKQDQKEYITDREFTISEISKIFDEINWYSANSAQAPWELTAWLQIQKFNFRGDEPILNVAVTILTLLGWSYEEAHRYLFNENKLILNVRWGIKTPQIPFAPGVDNPQNVFIKNANLPETEQTLVDAYRKLVIDKKNPAATSGKSTNTTKAVKCSKCNYFYDSNRFVLCPYCIETIHAGGESTKSGKRKIRGKRLVLLIFAIFFSIPLVTVFAFIVEDPLGSLMGLGLYGWWPAILWWLFFRKGKNKSSD